MKRNRLRVNELYIANNMYVCGRLHHLKMHNDVFQINYLKYQKLSNNDIACSWGVCANTCKTAYAHILMNAARNWLLLELSCAHMELANEAAKIASS